MKTKVGVKLLLTVIICNLAGIVGSFFTSPAIQSGWYAGIVKPVFNPPAWIFAPVWTILFVLMGISAGLVWIRLDTNNSSARFRIKIALVLFAIQLILNTLWSIIFFGLHGISGAFVEIIFLWFAIGATIITFAKISRPAALLLVPYILWVSFAGYLNYSIWQLNPSTGSPQGLGQVMCTQDAKQCPDGSYVSRSGPACEFAPCPSTDSTHSPQPRTAPAGAGQLSPENWKTFTDKTIGIVFQYPQQLATKYIHPVAWPPKVQVLNKPFTCVEGGSQILQNGQTLKQMINDRQYCVTKESEGAAGSIYTNYAYAFSNEGKTIIFTVTLQAVQCANYDDPQKTECEKERGSFNIDDIVDGMAQSLKIQ